MLIELNVDIEEEDNWNYVSEYITKECFINNLDILRDKLNWDIISNREIVTYKLVKRFCSCNWNWKILTERFINKITEEKYNETSDYCDWNKKIIVNKLWNDKKYLCKIEFDLISYADFINTDILYEYLYEDWDWNVLLKNKKIGTHFIDKNLEILNEKLDWKLISENIQINEEFIIKHPNWKYDWKIITNKSWINEEVFLRHGDWPWDYSSLSKKEWFNNENMV